MFRVTAMVFLITGFLFAPLRAEVITLRSGQVIQAKILQKTDRYVTVDIEGVAVPYFNDDIESIQADPVPVVEYLLKPAPSETRAGKSGKSLPAINDYPQDMLGADTSSVYNNELSSNSFPANSAPYVEVPDSSQSFEPQYSAGVENPFQKQYDQDWSAQHIEQKLHGAVNSQFLN